jgi:ATP-dependent exoDNAse (exonuclease V) alpha subunit
MRDLGVPVKQIKAHHTGTGAVEADWEKGGNLHKTLPICLGARVMLTENLWTERGLVNGALGTVKGLHWSEGADLEKDVPTILIEFDGYDGPLLEDFEGGRVVPIAPSKREFAINNVACTRTQVPLTIAWAITVHKAQGITADKIVTNIAEKDHVVGLTYVAISRVKALKGLLFEEPFDYSRFRSGKTSKTEMMRLADYARRLPQHVPVAVPELE